MQQNEQLDQQQKGMDEYNRKPDPECRQETGMVWTFESSIV